ncbi:MAG: serine protease [Hyphomicrobiaceae bacterium]|nr:serine protease [Hyphomicrobiaceae bacterium]
MEPTPEDYNFDLVRLMGSVVAVTSKIPDDALTAGVLGTERAGNGVLIGDGLVLTIGYLVTEAETLWLSFNDGATIGGHVLGYDQETGFGLIQALGRVAQSPVPLGDSDGIAIGDRVVVCGAGGVSHSVAARVVARQEFAGYWEYVLDEALFTAPAHPHWGGTAVISQTGELLGIGSLQVQQASVNGKDVDLNMIVPINLLKPILDDLKTIGQANRPPRPWLGVYATEVGSNVIIAGVAPGGPNEDSDLRVGDIVLAVEDNDVQDLPDFFRQVWAAGPAGTEIRLQVHRDGEAVDIVAQSANRRELLRRPIVH